MRAVFRSETLRAACRTASGAVAGFGCLALAGWALHTAAFWSLFPALAAVPPLVAAGFLAAGLSLWLSQVDAAQPRAHAARSVAFAAAALVVLIGVLTLLASILGRGSTTMDRLLFAGFFGARPVTPDAALDVFLLGCALMLMDGEGRGGRRLAAFLALTTLAFTLLVIIGYLYGVRPLHGAVSEVLMAPQAAVALALLSVGVLGARPHRSVVETQRGDSAGGVAGRRLLPTPVGVLVVMGLAALATERGLYDSPVALTLVVVLSVAVVGTLLWWSFRLLFRAESERRQTEKELREANVQLAGWVGAVEQRDSEINRIAEVGSLLQNCATAEEAYRVAAKAAGQLFPERPGALYVIIPPGELLDTVAVWGAPAAVFRPEECWALRRGRPHIVEDTSTGLLCAHLTEPLPAGYVCVPLLAQGAALGVLHLRGGPFDPTEHEGSPRYLLESEERLAVTVGDQIALALANLRLRETLRTQAIRDPLTGVFNRRYMEESLDRELRRAARRGYPISVIMLDVDHFRRVNETAGREAGDTLLRGLGEFLRARIRKEDIACRLDGGEFALILPEATLDVARQRAESLRDGFKRLDATQRGKSVGDASLSLGVAVAPQHGSTTDALLRSAQTALRRAKDGGRDQVTTAV